MSYRLNWKLLRANRCPKDGSYLVREAHGLRCNFKDEYYREECTFFITTEKANEVKEKLRKNPPAKRV